MLKPLLFLILLIFWLAQELVGRRAHALKPATVGELYRYGQKKTSPSTRISSLYFALITLMLFALWECVVWFLFGRSISPWISVLGLGAYFAELHLRRKNFSAQGLKRGLSQEDIWLLVFFTATFLASGISLLLCPWIIFRAKFLPRLKSLPLR